MGNGKSMGHLEYNVSSFYVIFADAKLNEKALRETQTLRARWL